MVVLALGNLGSCPRRNTRWVLGNGDSIRFLDDVWFGEKPLWETVSYALQEPSPSVRETCKMVRWIPPLQGLLLNVDGASKGNPCPCGGGSIVRNAFGIVILAFSHFYGFGTSLLAEARAMCDGIQLALEQGFYVAKISTDSMVLVNSFRTGVGPSWECYRWRRTVLEFMQQYQVRITHVYREANQYMVLHFPSLFDASLNSCLRSSRPDY
ncbi:hypothetical protein Taro_027141 [Colocasia esculenta]|uniref:RNase H type-1 domain-containing protein n=1 Tax=Colocasia esculenta TaxID=4460 RepID=A0A843VDR9_COLES|nr:hypothetical protein [Colocasia esculenta]